MAADQEAVEAVRKTFYSWDTWWPAIKITWPLWILLILIILYKIFIEPKIFWRINKWKKKRREKWEKEYKDKK